MAFDEPLLVDICYCGELLPNSRYGEGSSSFLLSCPHQIESVRTAAYQLPLQLGSPHALLSQHVLTP